MPNDYDWISAGFDRIEGMVLDANGIICGTTTTAPTGAAGSAGFRILGAQEATGVGAPPPDVVPINGDDNYLGGFLFTSAKAREFSLKAAVSGLNPNSYMGSGNVYQIGNSDISFLDSTPFSPVNVALLINSQSKSQVSGNVGTGMWSGVILAKVQGIPLGRETFAMRAAGVFNWHFVISQSDRFPWGETFVPAVHGVNTATYMPWSSNNRKAWHRFTGDGSTTVFGPLKYTPASTSLNDVVVYKNNYRQSANITVNTTTKQLTFVTPPALNDVIPVYYDNTGS